MDQPVTEDEHKEKVQDGDRKERKEERGGVGVKEKNRQSKDRKTEHVQSVCLHV